MHALILEGIKLLMKDGWEGFKKVVGDGIGSSGELIQLNIGSTALTSDPTDKTIRDAIEGADIVLTIVQANELRGLYDELNGASEDILQWKKQLPFAVSDAGTADLRKKIALRSDQMLEIEKQIWVALKKTERISASSKSLKAG